MGLDRANIPLCLPLMDASSPSCVCLQCETVRMLRPEFPGLVALRLSRDGAALALIQADAHAHELWIGEREPLRLRRAWRTHDAEGLAPPALSPDGQRACVPLLGAAPGLFIVSMHGEPERITAGFDVDPRWSERGIVFYRLVEGRPQTVSVILDAA